MNREVLNVYFIMGTINCVENPLETLRKALDAGITCFQLREKGEGSLIGKEYEAFARACQKLCKTNNVPFIINDDVDLALKLDADGIHVGQDDAALATFRQQAKGKMVGVSVHTPLEMQAAIRAGADYVGIGPIYATQSKTDANPPAGLGFLKEMRIEHPAYPIVGIGGITEENAQNVRLAGADGVSVISVICQSANIQETVKKLKY